MMKYETPTAFIFSFIINKKIQTMTTFEVLYKHYDSFE